MKPLISSEKLLRQLVIVEHPKDGKSDSFNFNIKNGWRKYLGLHLNQYANEYIQCSNDEKKKSVLSKRLLKNGVFLDRGQTEPLKHYWKNEYIRDPHWRSITIESYYSDDHLIFWAWQQSGRLYPAFFSKFNDGNTLGKLCDALWVDPSNKAEILKCQIKAFYLKITSKAISLCMKQEALKDGWLKIAEVLFETEYQVFPYISGQMCRALPLPSKKEGSIGEEWTIASRSVLSTLGELSSAWKEEKSRVFYVSGSPGAGKEGSCRAIHVGMARKGDFDVVDMSNLDNVRVQLFGETAPDGYIRPGKISGCRSGTLLLDELNKSNSDIRSMLLRPLQSKDYYPFNSSRIEKVDDVAFILASPHKKAVCIAKSKSSSAMVRKEFEPPDLWTRIETSVHIKHPFEDNEAKHPEIAGCLFSLFWVNAFYEILQKDQRGILGILWRMGKSDEILQPSDHITGNTWQQQVYKVTFRGDITVKYESSRRMDMYKRVYVAQLLRVKKRSIKKYSIREIRSNVIKLAHHSFDSLVEPSEPCLMAYSAKLLS